MSELPLSRHLRDLPEYAFSRLDRLRAEVEARGGPVIDLGMGEPAEPTPEFIRAALHAGVRERLPYPRAAGRGDLRRAAVRWAGRRFGVELDPERHVLPVNGTKEAIFTLPLAVVDRERRPVVLVPDPGYPVYALGASAAGAEVRRLPLAGPGFLPDLASIPREVWERASLLWLNTPGNPTGAVASLDYLRDAADRCRRHGVLLASDEAYADIYFDDPPPSALQAGTGNVLVTHSLSKRSAMAGYRSGFVAGDPRLIAALRRFRPAVGVATPEFVQEAARAAWEDDDHGSAVRAVYRERRDLMVNGLRALGFSPPEVCATFFVWLPVPGGEGAEAFAARCLEAGVLVLPGPALGPSGEGFVRLSLTRDRTDLEEALARLARVSV